MVETRSQKRLLLTGKTVNVLYHRGRYYTLGAAGGAERLLCSAPFRGFRTVCARLPLMARISRSEPRTAIWIDEGQFLTAQKEGIWRVDSRTGTVCLEHRFESGMAVPLSFCALRGLTGFPDGVLYGTYHGRTAKADAAIWLRTGPSEWRIAYTFPKGRVLHIHRLIPDYENDRLLALTGDSDYESGIWEFRGGFTAPHLLLGGSQQYRACVAFPKEGHIVFATDTPLEQNYLYDYNEATGQVQVLCPLPGPVIYSGSFMSKEERVYCFSTSVEPDDRKHGWSYLLTRRCGPGVLTRESYVFAGNRRQGFREVCAFRKDRWPMGLCGFGNAAFPVGETEHFLICPQNVQTYDRKTLEVTF